MLSHDPKTRPDLETIENHSWFKDMENTLKTQRKVVVEANSMIGHRLKYVSGLTYLKYERDNIYKDSQSVLTIAHDIL
jgi:hypothetical protein